MLTRLFPFPDPTHVTPDLGRRLRALADDCDRHERGRPVPPVLLQGEALEVELESPLSSRFPRDLIEPVAKGEFGGDVVHRVLGPGGQACGTILWESKRTRNWNDAWLAKLRDDQRAAKAEVALIASTALPKGIETFDLVDNVWVTEPRFAIPLAIALRQSLIDVTASRPGR